MGFAFGRLPQGDTIPMLLTGLSRAVVLFLTVTTLCQAQTPVKTVQERLGYPPNSRLLIIHADDFGMNHSVNRAISEAHMAGHAASYGTTRTCFDSRPSFVTAQLLAPFQLLPKAVAIATTERHLVTRRKREHVLAGSHREAPGQQAGHPGALPGRWGPSVQPPSPAHRPAHRALSPPARSLPV